MKVTKEMRLWSGGKRMDFTAFIKRAQILMENRTANPLAPPISGKHQSHGLTQITSLLELAT